MGEEKILITGALGQIGSDLTEKLQYIYGIDHVIATDIKPKPDHFKGIYEELDATDYEKTNKILKKHSISSVFHLASLLSGTSELKPMLAWELNIKPLLYYLEQAKDKKIKKLFWPSSIAVFGKDTPKVYTSQFAVKNPNTVYGISKVAGENWCNYYYEKYGTDVRSVRFPGLISWKALAGGGTTDYAVEIFYKALESQFYSCFIKENTKMPMLYMKDAISGIVQLMQTPKENLSIHTSYNLAGISFTPKEIYEEIKKHIPDFKIEYVPDFREKIAESWPQSIDDSKARKDWNWNPQFDLSKITRDMLLHLKDKLNLSV